MVDGTRIQGKGVTGPLQAPLEGIRQEPPMVEGGAPGMIPLSEPGPSDLDILTLVDFLQGRLPAKPSVSERLAKAKAQFNDPDPNVRRTAYLEYAFAVKEDPTQVKSGDLLEYLGYLEDPDPTAAEGVTRGFVQMGNGKLSREQADPLVERIVERLQNEMPSYGKKTDLLVLSWALAPFVSTPWVDELVDVAVTYADNNKPQDLRRNAAQVLAVAAAIVSEDRFPKLIEKLRALLGDGNTDILEIALMGLKVAAQAKRLTQEQNRVLLHDVRKVFYKKGGPMGLTGELYGYLFSAIDSERRRKIEKGIAKAKVVSWFEQLQIAGLRAMSAMSPYLNNDEANGLFETVVGALDDWDEPVRYGAAIVLGALVGLTDENRARARAVLEERLETEENRVVQKAFQEIYADLEKPKRSRYDPVIAYFEDEYQRMGVRIKAAADLTSIFLMEDTSLERDRLALIDTFERRLLEDPDDWTRGLALRAFQKWETGEALNQSERDRLAPVLETAIFYDESEAVQKDAMLIYSLMAESGFSEAVTEEGARALYELALDYDPFIRHLAREALSAGTGHKMPI